jgi:hypothetical protein
VQSDTEDARRIRPLRVALRNQRDDLLAFAGVLDGKLASIAKAHEIHQSVVREACVLQCLASTSSAYWQGWNRLRAKTGCKFHAVFDAVSRARRKRRAAVRLSRTSTRDCATTSRCVVTWVAHIWTCCGPS